MNPQMNLKMEPRLSRMTKAIFAPSHLDPSRTTSRATSKSVSSHLLILYIRSLIICLTGSTQKLRDRYNTAPNESKTLQSLVRCERAAKQYTATEGLLWLVRTLDFIVHALNADMEKGGKQALGASFRSAYQATLAAHHNFLMRPIVNMAMGATPTRSAFMAKLAGQETTQQKLNEEMAKWVAAMEQRVAILKVFCASKEAQWK